MATARQTVLLYLSIAFAASSLNAQLSDGLNRRTPESAEDARRTERQVTLDVQVTDRSGKYLGGLTRQSFALLDNGQSRAIDSFQEIDGTGQAATSEVVLVLDMMNASFQDVVIERQGIEKFLLQNGGHLALPVSIVFLADTGVKISTPSKDGKVLAEDLARLKTPMRVLGSAQGGYGAQDRSQRSLHALQMLCTYETARPGRKLLVWVGPGWPLLSRSTADLSTQDQRRYFNNIVEITTAVRRAHVTLYSVTPLNLAQPDGQSPLLYQAYLRGVETPIQADSPNLALQVLAVHSGGVVLGQSGDLAGQLARCFEDSRGYYEITFEAAEGDAPPQYHALQLNLDQPGAIARTNTGYYTGVPQSTPVTPAAPPAVPFTVSTTPAASPVLKAEARLVIVDVTVLDKKGQPVKGLSANDFALREDNAPQTILNFEAHGASNDAVATLPPAAGDPAADGTFVVSNKPPPESVWNVVLVDLYNTPKEARGMLQDQLQKFLKQLPERQPVALVAMSSHIRIETSFQDGAGAAYLYLKKHGLGPLDPSIPANMIGSPGQELLMPSADLTGSSINNQANVDVDRQANRAQTTLACFSEVAKWLAPYPGRKNVYWLSGGFPLQGQPFGVAGYDLNNPGLGPDTKGGHPLPMQEKTDKELEAARVAIYPIDSRGVAALDADGVNSADSTYTANVAIVTAKDNDLLAARRSEMLEIAKATGGAVHISNDISRALRDDFNQANTYYTISYTPPGKESNGAYHRIGVSVDTPGTQLVHRQGYYAIDTGNGAKGKQDPFLQALQLAAPSQTALQFTSRLTKSGEDEVIKSALEPKTLNFSPDAKGTFLTNVDFAILEYAANGKVLEKSMVKLTGEMTPAQIAHLSPDTLSTTQTIRLHAGATVLVLGVRDNVSGRIGTVEFPLSAH